MSNFPQMVSPFGNMPHFGGSFPFQNPDFGGKSFSEPLTWRRFRKSRNALGAYVCLSQNTKRCFSEIALGI